MTTEVRACRRKNHDVWFPELPRSQPLTEFYQRQGYTCKSCSRKSASILGKQKRKAEKDGSFERRRRPRYDLATLEVEAVEAIAMMITST
ncbi:MAG: hypothetical protein ACMG6E_01245 [Candidatus Roizmanbacteria bacterium]